jgi:ABC-type antimicrobial peptide transport system ATPase subunit
MVLVMHNGEIIESGCPKALLFKEGSKLRDLALTGGEGRKG